MDVSTLLHKSIYISFYIINSKIRSNCKVILFFIIKLPNFNIISIKIETYAYYIHLQSSIPNTNTDTPIFSLEIDEILVQLKTNFINNFILWQSFNNFDDTRLGVYHIIAKSKSIARKLEVMIFFHNLI